MDNKKASAAGPRPRAGKAKENHIKKQATPSQVRANHEKQQQAQKAAARQSTSIKAATDAKKTIEKQLDAKVRTLHEQADKSLEAYSRQAGEIKRQISVALESQDRFHNVDQLNNVDDLRESIHKLSVAQGDEDGLEPEASQLVAPDEQQVAANDVRQAAMTECPAAGQPAETSGFAAEPATMARPTIRIQGQQADNKDSRAANEDPASPARSDKATPLAALAATPPPDLLPVAQTRGPEGAAGGDETEAATFLSNNCFEPLTARLDPETKYVALKSSMGRHFVHSPHLLEPICKKLIHLTNQIDALTMCNEQNELEISRLTSIKSKLGDLCRELQKSNNQIRIESLNMIKMEQNKAKDQAGKIQSTLSGVMKLFDENQQRNLTLKQENVDLQNKLKSLLEHCDNWEKCVETTLKQREIETRLARTEMARMSLLRNEEKERFFKEKSDLIKGLTMMKEQQSKIEISEAKLRSDLTNYASKYDECQEIIHKGLSKFQVESKRMLKQIEQGRRDYIQLLNKYEASNKKIKQLLEDKQSWAQSMGAANNKLEALERLCRALKIENDRLLQQQTTNSSIESQQICPSDRPGVV